jgi:hypothetical protein
MVMKILLFWNTEEQTRTQRKLTISRMKILNQIETFCKEKKQKGKKGKLTILEHRRSRT